MNGDWTAPALNTFGLNFVVRGYPEKTSAAWSVKDGNFRYRFILTDVSYWHSAWYMRFGPTTGSVYGGCFPIRLVRDIA